MKILRTAFWAIFFGLLLLSGCASMPSQVEMQKATEGYQLPKAPEARKGMIYVVRPYLIGGIVKFNVFLDDKEPASEMGYTTSNEYIYFNAEPGNHLIYSLAENWAELEVALASGEIIFLKQEPTFGVLYARNKLSLIDAVEGRYCVKTLKPGTIKQVDKPKK